MSEVNLTGCGVSELKIVRVEPGDVVVLRVRDMLSDDDREHTAKILKGTWPHNRVMVLEDGADIEVVRSSE